MKRNISKSFLAAWVFGGLIFSLGSLGTVGLCPMPGSRTQNASTPVPASALTPTGAQVIAALQLVPHAEGGFFRETYRSPLTVELPDGRRRPASTVIYFLLRAGEFSAWHTVAQDEMWHWYAGGPLSHYTLSAQQELTSVSLGPDWSAGQQTQLVVPAGTLQAALCPADVPYALVGCTVAPGFELDDFNLPERADLLARFPRQADLIQQLTRP